MPLTPIQKDTSMLRPGARIITTLGEEFISVDKVTLLEFLENCYFTYASISTMNISERVVFVKDEK